MPRMRPKIRASTVHSTVLGDAGLLGTVAVEITWPASVVTPCDA